MVLTQAQKRRMVAKIDRLVARGKGRHRAINEVGTSWHSYRRWKEELTGQQVERLNSGWTKASNSASKPVAKGAKGRPNKTSSSDEVYRGVGIALRAFLAEGK